MIRSAGTIAFVVRRASGALLAVYFFVWLARLHRHPLVPFGAELGRTGEGPLKIVEVLLIALLAVHALEGLSQVLVQRLHLMHRRASLLAAAVLVGLFVGAAHLPWFFAGVLRQ